MHTSGSEATLGDLVSVAQGQNKHKNTETFHQGGKYHASSSDTDVEVGEQQDVGNNEKDFIQKRLTLSFKSVTVLVKAPGEALGETLWSRVDPTQLLGYLKPNALPKRVRLKLDHAELKTC